MKNVSDFEKPFYGLKRQGTSASPKKIPLIIIAWQPKGKRQPNLLDGSKGPDEPKLNAVELKQLFFGPKNSVADWFRESSQGRYQLVPHPQYPVLGPFESKYWWPFYWRNGSNYIKARLTQEEWESNPYKVPPPPNSPHYYKDADGNIYYLDNEGFIGGHTHSWAEAIRDAAQIIDFGALDKDGDGFLSPDNDALIVIVKAQESTFGTRNYVTGSDVPYKDLIVDGVKIYPICEIYCGPPHGINDIAVSTEEIVHLAANYDDEYPDGNYRLDNDPRRPGQLSLSDAGHRPVHVEPYCRLKWGWLNPKVADRDGVYTLRDSATTGDALILQSLIQGHDDEFFIVENRWRGNSYDRYRDTNQGEGLAIWHCIEDPNLSSAWARRAVHLRRADPRLNANGYIQWTKTLFDGSDPLHSYILSDTSSPQNLRFRNGALSGLIISDISRATAQMTLRITMMTSFEVEKYQVAWNFKQNRGTIVLLFKGEGGIQLWPLEYNTYRAMLDQLRNEKPLRYDLNQKILLTLHEPIGEGESP